MIEAEASALGFAVCRFTHAALPQYIGERLQQAVGAGYHASMDWMAQTALRRLQPRAMWPQAQTAIVLAINYGPDSDPMQTLALKDRGNISVYARNRDYHDVVKGRLKQIAQLVAKRTGEEVKVFVDTAPLMEKPLAAQAGIGWQGKHTSLVSREHGCWLFLGVILTTADFAPDQPQSDLCGSCSACLDICPTKAFPKPYQLDARRCISYLTIEHKGPIAHEFRTAMGNRIYGCDDCLAVCPWNKFAAAASEAKLQARVELLEPELGVLAGLGDAAFRKLFAGTAIKRIGHSRFLRNVLIAIGNSADGDLVEAVRPHLADADPVVRGAAVWALAQLLDEAQFAALAQTVAGESDASVADEWHLGLKQHVAP